VQQRFCGNVTKGFGTRRETATNVGRVNLRSSKKVSGRWPLISGIVAIALAGAIGLLVALRRGDLPFEFDSEWMEDVLDERSIWLDVPARLLDWLGGGWVGVIVVPVGIVVVLCVVRRFWGAAYYAVAALVSVGLVQLLKAVVDRPRPEELLVATDDGSFPSGHVANAATMAVVLAIIFNRWWVWFAGVAYVLLMALSRTYLGAHWISDTIGGVLIGAGVAVIVWAPFAYRLGKERPRRR
jgi:undecaprenyl-diphosphatase